MATTIAELQNVCGNQQKNKPVDLYKNVDLKTSTFSVS